MIKLDKSILLLKSIFKTLYLEIQQFKNIKI